MYLSAQEPDAPEENLTVAGKLGFHASGMGNPLSMLGAAAYAGALQDVDSPREWRLGAEGYGWRVASTLGTVAIRTTLAFGLDATLHEDPRYTSSKLTGFWPRAGHALHETIFTRTDGGGHTFAFWRFGSAYGAAFLSNYWYPPRLNTVALGFAQGSLIVGGDAVLNLTREFGSDLKKKIFRHH